MEGVSPLSFQPLPLPREGQGEWHFVPSGVQRWSYWGEFPIAEGRAVFQNILGVSSGVLQGGTLTCSLKSACRRVS